MKTRCLQHEIDLPASPEKVFTLLHTPSAIRAWWRASQAIVVPKEEGFFIASWGPLDNPDTITAYHLRVFSPPRLLVLEEAFHHARNGPLPFKAEFMIAFTVEPRGREAVLRVEQDGFPADSLADAYYSSCVQNWRTAFEGIKKFLGG